MTGEMKLEDRGRKLNWKEACAILGCGKTHFYSLVKKGILPAFHLYGANKGLWVYENDCKSLLRQLQVHDLDKTI